MFLKLQQAKAKKRQKKKQKFLDKIYDSVSQLLLINISPSQFELVNVCRKEIKDERLKKQMSLANFKENIHRKYINEVNTLTTEYTQFLFSNGNELVSLVNETWTLIQKLNKLQENRNQESLHLMEKFEDIVNKEFEKMFHQMSSVQQGSMAELLQFLRIASGFAPTPALLNTE
eukprot:jgi/Bigna1/69499/fgenesh1_pg.9_\